MNRILLLAATLLLAACGGGGSAAGSMVIPQVTPRALTIAVVGDSISKLQVLPDSPIPCGYGATVACDYSTDGSLSYPTLIAQQTGSTVINLSSPGCRTAEDFPGTVSVLKQIAGIPANANVVIMESGTNDTSAHGASPQYATDIDAAVAAIHGQAPNAKIVFVGVRYYNGAIPARVDLWDAHIASLGTFIDLRPLFSAGVSSDFPDGTHPGANAVTKIATAVEQVL